MKKLFQTENVWSGLVLRVGLGVVMLPHGAQKLLGWFGGYGFSGTMTSFTDTMHVPALVALLVIISEAFGSLGLIFGFLTRVGAFGVLCVMTGAVVMVHWHNGFFMNWFGNQAGEGFEYHLLAITISIVLLIVGGGKCSMDRWIAKKLQS